MTQNEKELLLKDLSCRLPYGVKYMDILNPDEHPSTLQSIDNCGLVMANDGFSHEIENVKPYLFPISSMTEEQIVEFDKIAELDIKYSITQIKNDVLIWTSGLNRFNWLLKNHFDVYGLIDKGLAIDATNLNIY